MDIKSIRSSIEWNDLRYLTKRQKIIELLLSLPWLIASIYLYNIDWILAGLICSFFFFLTALRQAHGAQHYSLGFNRRFHDVFMALLSVLMLSSIHALQATHMHHHRHCLDESDIEAGTANMPWWKAIMVGPRFIIELHIEGFRLAKSYKKPWILLELGLIASWIPVGFIFLDSSIQWHLSAMILGECLTGFFAIWTVHHECDKNGIIARTQRGVWKNLISYEMFYHLEHHLFPAVPTPNLPELSKRLDEVQSNLDELQVF